VLITAATSGCYGADLIGSVNAAPMRLASPKSFIDGLGEDAVKDAILLLTVDISHTLGLKVTTEGV
jgi:EAL domain-containing protein (putative c-di-GMP-specific phosphodiesterase class I)